MKLDKGWLKRRIEIAAKEFESWPETIKNALKLNTKEK